MARIVISEFTDAASVERLRARFDVVYDPALVRDRPRLLSLLAQAEGLIVRNRTQIDAALLEAAPLLAIVGRLGAGLDNVDMAACGARNVKVVRATKANAVAVAEYVIAAALHLVRRAFQATEEVIAGRWPRQELIGGELAGRIMGLVGLGTIGREVARRARAFGMETIAHDPFVSSAEQAGEGTALLGLEEVLSRADVLSLHVPLTTATRHMIDAAALKRMKPDAILVNTARGDVIDEEALAAALRERRLGGAALDVFADEPMTAQAAAKFAGLPSLILTPHIAGVTDESNVRVSAVIADAVISALGKA